MYSLHIILFSDLCSVGSLSFLCLKSVSSSAFSERSLPGGCLPLSTAALGQLLSLVCALQHKCSFCRGQGHNQEVTGYK